MKGEAVAAVKCEFLVNFLQCSHDTIFGRALFCFSAHFVCWSCSRCVNRWCWNIVLRQMLLEASRVSGEWHISQRGHKFQVTFEATTVISEHCMLFKDVICRHDSTALLAGNLRWVIAESCFGTSSLCCCDKPRWPQSAERGNSRFINIVGSVLCFNDPTSPQCVRSALGRAQCVFMRKEQFHVRLFFVNIK